MAAGGASASPHEKRDSSQKERQHRLAAQESATRRLHSRLQQLLGMVKRNVGSAELSIRSQLQWVGTRGRQSGHLNMKCHAVKFVGPVNLSVNINSRAQLMSRLTRLVTRRISVIDDGSLLVDFLIPSQPATSRRMRNGTAEGLYTPDIPATLEALSLRRHKPQPPVAATATEGDDPEQPSQPKDPMDMLTCLVEARVTDWSCGVHSSHPPALPAPPARS